MPKLHDKIKKSFEEKLEKASVRQFVLQTILYTALIYLVAVTVTSVSELIIYSTGYSDTSFLGFLGFFLSSLLVSFIPITIISTVIVYIMLYPMITVLKQHEKGESVTKEEYRAARKRSARIPVIILALNIIIPIFTAIIFNSFSGISSHFMLSLLKDISIFLLCSTAQIAVYQRILMRPRAILKIYSIDRTTPNWASRNMEKIQFYASLLFIMATLVYAFFNYFQYTMDAVKPPEDGVINQIEAQADEALSKMRAHMESQGAGGLAERGEELRQELDAKAQEIAGGLVSMLITLSTLLLIVIIAVDIVVTSTKRTQEKILQRLLEDMAEGEADLTRRVLIVQADETGELSDQLNRVLDKLQTMFRHIKGNAEKVTESSSAISNVLESTVAAVEEMSASASQINENAENNKTIVNDSKESLEKTLVSLEEISNNVNTQAAYVEQTSSAMTQMVANIQSVNDVTAKAAKLAETLSAISSEGGTAVSNSINAVKDIETSSSIVSNLVTVISKILAQTNMLAMNAAIEAAHAGDAGRGFAVVAEEVRDLADNSASNLKTISENMKDVMSKVNNGVNLSETAGSSLQEIGEKTLQTTNLMNEVAAAMEEQAAGANEVLGSINSLVESSSAISTLSDQQKKNNQAMRNNLTNTVNAFSEVQMATSALAIGNQEILKGIDELKDVIHRNGEVVQELHNDLDGYKV